MLVASFWVIPRRQNCNCRRFGTYCQFHLHGLVSEVYFAHKPMKMELTVGSETSAITILTPGNYLKRSYLHSEHGESLKRKKYFVSPKMTLFQIALLTHR